MTSSAQSERRKASFWSQKISFQCASELAAKGCDKVAVGQRSERTRIVAGKDLTLVKKRGLAGKGVDEARSPAACFQMLLPRRSFQSELRERAGVRILKWQLNGL